MGLAQQPNFPRRPQPFSKTAPRLSTIVRNALSFTGCPKSRPQKRKITGQEGKCVSMVLIFASLWMPWGHSTQYWPEPEVSRCTGVQRARLSAGLIRYRVKNWKRRQLAWSVGRGLSLGGGK